ncbi:MAG: hypothetical protein RL038_232 [Actinomycetota bacterium]|jgi:copper(I)-binding protein
MKKLIAAAAAVLLTLTACAEEEAEWQFEGAIEVTNSYVRATDGMTGMEAMMTGAFMDIKNNSDEDVSLIAATSEAAGVVEIHEVVDGVMRQKEGGIFIAAGETQVLKPGGNHVMLMELAAPLIAGAEVRFTLEFSNGELVEVLAPIKEVNLDQEEYDDSAHSGM